MEGAKVIPAGDGHLKSGNRDKKNRDIPYHYKGVPLVVETHIVYPMVVYRDKEMRRDMKKIVDLMKELSINMMNNGGRDRGPNGAKGCGRGSSRGYYVRPPSCFNCGDLVHYSNECNKPRDMYYVPT